MQTADGKPEHAQWILVDPAIVKNAFECGHWHDSLFRPQQRFTTRRAPYLLGGLWYIEVRTEINEATFGYRQGFDHVPSEGEEHAALRFCTKVLWDKIITDTKDAGI